MAPPRSTNDTLGTMVVGMGPTTSSTGTDGCVTTGNEGIVTTGKNGEVAIGDDGVVTTGSDDVGGTVEKKMMAEIFM